MATISKGNFLDRRQKEAACFREQLTAANRDVEAAKVALEGAS